MRKGKRTRKGLKALDNPLFLSKRAPWLYWKVCEFSWSRFFFLFENPLARASILASGVGYLVFLNDILADKYGFTFVLAGNGSILGLSMVAKLRLLYFGLIFLALARILYLARRPHSIRYGPTLKDWVSHGLSNFVYRDFLELHDDIETNQNRTPYGRYYTDHWDAFVEDAIWKDAGRTDGMSDEEKKQCRKQVSFSEAKAKHEDLLRGILIDRYHEYSSRNKVSLLVAVLLAVFGYALFLIPNADLFLSIVASLF